MLRKRGRSLPPLPDISGPVMIFMPPRFFPRWLYALTTACYFVSSDDGTMQGLSSKHWTQLSASAGRVVQLTSNVLWKAPSIAVDSLGATSALVYYPSMFALPGSGRVEVVRP